MIVILLDIQNDRFEAVEVFGIPALYTEERISRSTVPNGMYAYDMQTSESDWTRPDLIAPHITDDHYGTILTASPIALMESGCRTLRAEDFKWPRPGDRPTVVEFAERHGYEIRPPARPNVEKSVKRPSR